jgi:hypothetical protein
MTSEVPAPQADPVEEPGVESTEMPPEPEVDDTEDADEDEDGAVA